MKRPYNASLLRGTMTLSELEIVAVQFHDAGRSWQNFWRGYWKAVCVAARRSRKQFPLGSMIDRLREIVERGAAQDEPAAIEANPFARFEGMTAEDIASLPNEADGEPAAETAGVAPPFKVLQD